MIALLTQTAFFAQTATADSLTCLSPSEMDFFLERNATCAKLEKDTVRMHAIIGELKGKINQMGLRRSADSTAISVHKFKYETAEKRIGKLEFDLGVAETKIKIMKPIAIGGVSFSIFVMTGLFIKTVILK